MFGRAPKKPEELFDSFLQDLKTAFGETLETIILYGSGARSDYMPGRSDLNFLVCLSPEGLKDLDQVWKYINRWQRWKIATPLFMTKDFIRSSLDVFPVEFLNMKIHHRCLLGEDVLAGLDISPSHLRLQLEREFRGKLLHLREGFVASKGREGDLKNLISASISAFASLFVGLLHLRGVPIPETRRGLFSSVERAFNLEGGVLERCLDVREGRVRLKKGETLKLCRDYMEVIRRVCRLVDENFS